MVTSIFTLIISKHITVLLEGFMSVHVIILFESSILIFLCDLHFTNI